MSGREMLDSVCRGFEKALCRTDAIVAVKPKSPASHLSSKFVYEVASAVRCRLFPDHCLKVIRVKDDGTKDSGEWLVDACVSEENDGFTERIVFAMESESATGKKEFDEDFAKLVHLNASVKLYLNGLNQTTPDGLENYICGRREYARDLIRRTRSSGRWFLGFWPSPGKLEAHGDVSAWQCLPRHLRTIRLFEFRGHFVEVRASNAE